MFNQIYPGHFERESLRDKILTRRFKSISAVALVSFQLFLSPASGAKLSPQRCGLTFIDNLAHLSEEEIRQLTRSILVQRKRVLDFDGLAENAILLRVRKQVYERVFEICQKPSACTSENIVRIVDQSLTETISKTHEFKLEWKKFRGNIMLVSLAVGVAVGSQMMKSHLPAEARFLAEFVTIASSIALYKLGGPLWDYMSGLLSRGAFRLSQGQEFKPQMVEMGHLWDQYERLQSSLTPAQQTAAGRELSLLINLEGVIIAAAEGLRPQNNYTPADLNMAAARIAGLLIKARRYYPEVDLKQDRDILRTWEMLFLDQIHMKSEDYQQLRELVLEKLRIYDPADTDHPHRYQEYESIVRHWFDRRKAR